uniref:Uncharacterized protein n=1 Tax=Timema cristinae TaxID=61476 RepID=A0A7R9GU14_TIMCR|nr:unnamed protein product [Timema cristinae]
MCLPFLGGKGGQPDEELSRRPNRQEGETKKLRVPSNRKDKKKDRKIKSTTRKDQKIKSTTRKDRMIKSTTRKDRKFKSTTRKDRKIKSTTRKDWKIKLVPDEDLGNVSDSVSVLSRYKQRESKDYYTTYLTTEGVHEESCQTLNKLQASLSPKLGKTSALLIGNMVTAVVLNANSSLQIAVAVKTIPRESWIQLTPPALNPQQFGYYKDNVSKLLLPTGGPGKAALALVEDTLSDKTTSQFATILPDYMLVFAVPVLVHYPEYTSHDNADQLEMIRQCLWFILEPLMTKNDSYCFGFYKDLIEKMKNHKDAIKGDDDSVNFKLWAICDIILNLILTKTTNFDMKEFPAETRIPQMYFRKNDDPVFINTKCYLPIAVQMQYQQPKKGITMSLVLDKGTKRLRGRQPKQSSQVMGIDEQDVKSCSTYFWTADVRHAGGYHRQILTLYSRRLWVCVGGFPSGVSRPEYKRGKCRPHLSDSQVCSVLGSQAVSPGVPSVSCGVKLAERCVQWPSEASETKIQIPGIEETEVEESGDEPAIKRQARDLDSKPKVEVV